MRRVVEPFDPNERLLERILSKENLEAAWKRVKANHGAPGVDGITVEQFPNHTRELWAGIRQSLLTGTYQRVPVKRVGWKKGTGYFLKYHFLKKKEKSFKRRTEK